MKVELDGKEHEIEPSQLKLDEGFALITPDKVPDGYFTQEALENKIQTRLSKAEENVKSKLSDDNSFHRQVLDKYGVQLGEDGKPKGLKPTVDVDEVKHNVAERLKGEYEEKINKLQSTVDSFKNKGKHSAIVEGANKIGIDGKWLEPLVEGGSPYIIKELEGNFEWNDEIGDYALKEKDGTFAVDGSGFIPASKYFEKNQDKFKHLMKDNRQRGSNFNGQGNAESVPQGDISDWNATKKADYIHEHGRDADRKLVDKSVSSKKKK